MKKERTWETPFDAPIHNFKFTKPHPPTNFMIEMNIEEMSAMVEYAIDKGFKARLKYFRYHKDGRKIYMYNRSTLAAVRYAIKRKCPLPKNQNLIKRKPNQHIGITLLVTLDSSQ